MRNILNSGRVILAFLIFVLGWFVWGCCKAGTVTEYYPVYKEVKVPVPCGVAVPERPVYKGDAAADNLNILQYAEELETALDVCTKPVKDAGF